MAGGRLTIGRNLRVEQLASERRSDGWQSDQILDFVAQKLESFKVQEVPGLQARKQHCHEAPVGLQEQALAHAESEAGGWRKAATQGRSDARTEDAYPHHAAHGAIGGR